MECIRLILVIREQIFENKITLKIVQKNINFKKFHFQDEAELKKRELKGDKTIKRIYVKPVHDTTFLHFKAI